MFRFLFGNICLTCRFSVQINNLVCKNCIKRLNSYKALKWIDNTLVLFRYEGMIRSIILNGKYRFNKKVWAFWNMYFKDLPLNKDSVILYVPTTFKRYCFRGFNQSYLLAKELEKCGYGKVHFFLKRVKFGGSTSLLGKEDRLESIKGNFEMTFGYDNFKNRDIVLVDDVLTTGATLKEIENLLITYGFDKSKIKKLALASGRLKASKPVV